MNVLQVFENQVAKADTPVSDPSELVCPTISNFLLTNDREPRSEREHPSSSGKRSRKTKGKRIFD